jgi:hypothetical protein
MIDPILTYGSGVWGMRDIDDIFLSKFCKEILGLGSRTSLAAVQGVNLVNYQ